MNDATAGQTLTFGFIARLFAGSGYVQLAERYATSSEPVGRRFERQTVELGGRARYKRCTRLIVTREGLYVRVMQVLLGRHPALLIPWSEITAVKTVALYLDEARRLSVGESSAGSITVWLPVFNVLEPFLAPELQRRPIT
jgi:hypothetical protein